MIFNLTGGTEFGFNTNTGEFSNIQEYTILHGTLTIAPLTVILLATTSGVSNLRVYYRDDQDAEFNMRTNDSSSSIYGNLVSCVGDNISISCYGATSSQPVNIEWIAIGGAV